MKSPGLELLKYAVKSKSFAAELLTHTKEHYYDADSKLPAKILLDYYKNYKDIPSYDIICDFIDNRGFPEKDRVKGLFQQVYAENVTLADGNFPFLLDKFKTQYNERYIKERVRNISQNLSGQYNVDDLNDYIKKTALEVSTIKTSEIREQGTLQESAKERLQRYKDVKANPYLARGVCSGFRELDNITNGFRGSELILISGPTSSGKSVLLMNMAINGWTGNNKITQSESEWNNSGSNVWFITIENPKAMLERRIDACLAGIPSDGIRDGKLDEYQEKLYKQALKFQFEYGNNKKFYISDLGRGISVSTIEAEYEKTLSLFKPDIIFIDYLGIMKANDPTGTDWLDQGSIAADLHEFCRAIKDTPIVTASQMKSGMRTQNGIKRFTGDPESVARSKMITDNVNINLQIKKDEDFHQSSYLELYVAKNRDGRTGDIIQLSKEFWRQRVCDLDLNTVLPTKNTEEE